MELLDQRLPNKTLISDTELQHQRAERSLTIGVQLSGAEVLCGKSIL